MSNALENRRRPPDGLGAILENRSNASEAKRPGCHPRKCKETEGTKIISAYNFFKGREMCNAILKRCCKCGVFTSVQISSISFRSLIIRKIKLGIFSARPQGLAQYFLSEKVSKIKTSIRFLIYRVSLDSSKAYSAFFPVS